MEAIQFKRAELEEQRRIEAEKKAKEEELKRIEAEKKQKEEEAKRHQAELATANKEKERALAELAKFKAEQKAKEEAEKRKTEPLRASGISNCLVPASGSGASYYFGIGMHAGRAPDRGGCLQDESGNPKSFK